MLDDDDEDEDETTLEESILEMANATFRPMRRLRWHYRSRHSGLIKFSNRIIYEDDLIVFPSANEGKLGILHKSKPIASAVLDMEEGDEIEYLVGSYVRKAVIENVIDSSEVS